MSKSPAVITESKYHNPKNKNLKNLYDHPYAVLYHHPETGQRVEVLYYAKKKGQHDLVHKLFNKQHPKLKDKVFGVHWKG